MTLVEGRRFGGIRRPIHRVGRDLTPSLPDAWEPRELPSPSPLQAPLPAEELSQGPGPKGTFRVDPEA